MTTRTSMSMEYIEGPNHRSSKQVTGKQARDILKNYTRPNKLYNIHSYHECYPHQRETYQYKNGVLCSSPDFNPNYSFANHTVPLSKISLSASMTYSIKVPVFKEDN